MACRKGVKATFKDYIEGFPYYTTIMQNYIHPASLSRLQLIRDKLTSLLDQSGKDVKWEIIFPQSDPLKFKDVIRNGSRLEIQLNCKIRGTASSLSADRLNIDEYNIELWIRSLERDLSYRQNFDSKKMCQRLSKNDWKRVIMSFHVDFNPNAEIHEPIYHLQAGGRLNEEELSWIPEAIEEPRFYFFPLDVVLLSELILMNYRPEIYDDLRKKPEWKKRVIYSQNLYLKPYIFDFYGYLDDNNHTLLNHLAKCY